MAPAMPASPATVTPAAARMQVSARLAGAETAPGEACDPVPARVIAPPSGPVTCADVPTAGHLQPAHRGSYAGTSGPPRHRYPRDGFYLLLCCLPGVPIGRLP